MGRAVTNCMGALPVLFKTGLFLPGWESIEPGQRKQWEGARVLPSLGMKSTIVALAELHEARAHAPGGHFRTPSLLGIYLQTKIIKKNNNNNNNSTNTAEGLCCSPSLWCLGVPHPWCSEQWNNSRGDEHHGRFGEEEWTLCPWRSQQSLSRPLRGCSLTFGVTFRGHCWVHLRRVFAFPNILLSAALLTGSSAGEVRIWADH